MQEADGGVRQGAVLAVDFADEGVDFCEEVLDLGEGFTGGDADLEEDDFLRVLRAGGQEVGESAEFEGEALGVVNAVDAEDEAVRGKGLFEVLDLGSELGGGFWERVLELGGGDADGAGNCGNASGFDCGLHVDASFVCV